MQNSSAQNVAQNVSNCREKDPVLLKTFPDPRRG
jgi:hypothetical protein